MTQKLLLIDDNLPDRIRYRRMLAGPGTDYSTVEAADGEAGLAAVDHSIACVLLDMDLPDISGLDVLARIQAMPDAPPVVMLTGEEDAAVSVEALQRGAADYLMKRRIDEDRVQRAVRGAMERSRLQRELRDQQRRLALFYRLASQTDDALLIVEPFSGLVTECNHSARVWLGVQPGTLDQPLFLPAAFETAEQWQTFLRQAEREGSARFEWSVVPDSGQVAVFEILARRVEEQGRPYIVAVGRDITERVSHEQSLLDQSRRDGLTGIFNRRAFDERLAELSAPGKPLSVLMMDVDQFKSYNDRLGHQAGDDCLRAVARALSRACIEVGGTLARYGGEEFAVLFSESDEVSVGVSAELLRKSVAALGIPHPESVVSPTVTISIGGATRPVGDPRPGAALLGEADAALYRAKEMGRNKVCLASSGHIVRISPEVGRILVERNIQPR